MKRLFPLYVLLMWMGCALAADKTIRLATPPGGFPPFIIVAPGQPTSGIVVDVLQEIAALQGYQVRHTDAPKKRVEQMILDGQLDASPRALEWGGDPRVFVFTDSVIRIRDLVFSRRQAPLRYRSPDDLLGKSLGTHLGYVYPQLTPYFDSKKILRADAGTEKSMLLMLQAGRTDALVMNELVALWLIKTENLQDQFSAADTELDGHEYRLMFGPQWSEFVAHFNRELARMKRDGRLARVIGKYRLGAP